MICDTDLFTNLQVVVLLNMPRYRDDFETSRILSDYIKSIEQDEASMHKMRLDAVVIMSIYELIFSISANNEDLEGMQDILVRAKKASSCFHRKEAYAVYYNMLSEYYDIPVSYTHPEPTRPY